MELFGFIGCCLLLWLLHKWDLRNTRYQKEMMNLREMQRTKQIDINTYLDKSWETFKKYNMK